MIGFSVTDVVKAATDPRAQRLVAAASTAYAPEQTARITAATQQALTNYRQARAILRTPGPRRVPIMPMPDDDSPASMVTPTRAPAAQRGNILLFGAIGAALLIVLMMRK